MAIASVISGKRAEKRRQMLDERRIIGQPSASAFTQGSCLRFPWAAVRRFARGRVGMATDLACVPIGQNSAAAPSKRPRDGDRTGSAVVGRREGECLLVGRCSRRGVFF